MSQPAQSLQLPVTELPDRPWDVIVIGAGPAGSFCARSLAQNGRKVLLLDKERFPRHKVCGDLLIADSIGLLRRVGLYDRIAALAYHTDAIEVFSPSGNEFKIPGEFLALKRFRLDYELSVSAVESGATFAHGNAVAVGDTSSGAQVTTSESSQPLAARIIVFATGAVVDLPSRAGLVADPHPSAVAMRCYVTSSHEIAHTIIAYDRSILPGYGWIVPLGRAAEGEFAYNVGCGTSYRFLTDGSHHLKRALATFTEQFGPARTLLARSSGRSKVAGASLRCGLSDIERAVAGNRLLIGESAGATYPFTGEGIGKAMETGRLAAEVIEVALSADNPHGLARYRDELRRLQPRYAGYATAEKWLGHLRLNDFVARRIARSPYLRTLVSRFMAETGDPGDLFTLGSLLKSFWK